MENKLILMGFKGETTDVLTLYKDYGEITLIYDVTNKKMYVPHNRNVRRCFGNGTTRFFNNGGNIK
jgi:hypothetical protein